LAFATALGLQEALRFIERVRPLTLTVVRPGAVVPAAERALRPNYPYSVIPGGAYSPAELRYSIAKDPVVRAHYADFDLKSARLVTLASDRFQYASFRMRNKVYWTHSKIRILKGEVLLTDGVHFARTRCGNRLCDTSQTETTTAEPPLQALSLPPFSFQLLINHEISLDAAPLLEDLAQTHPELIFDLPRVAPYLPPAPPMQGTMFENWLPVNAIPPSFPILTGYPLAAPPIMPGRVPTPILTLDAPPLAITTTTEVPEPGSSIYLFLIAFAISLWLITRWMREDTGSEEHATEDGN
jgi:hypothetical protein